MKRKQITTEEFDRELELILDDMTGAQLLSIPGVYEAVSEEFNNQVIENWETKQ